MGGVDWKAPITYKGLYYKDFYLPETLKAAVFRVIIGKSFKKRVDSTQYSGYFNDTALLQAFSW